MVTQKYSKSRLSSRSSDNSSAKASLRVSTLKLYNEMDIYGHTVVTTDITFQLPNGPVWDELRVKVDGGTVLNVQLHGYTTICFPNS